MAADDPQPAAADGSIAATTAPPPRQQPQPKKYTLSFENLSVHVPGTRKSSSLSWRKERKKTQSAFEATRCRPQEKDVHSSNPGFSELAGLACVQPHNYTLEKILFLLPAFQTPKELVVAQNLI
jgi:hypothetical protein